MFVLSISLPGAPADFAVYIGRNVPEGEGVPDVEEEDPQEKHEEEVINETMFTFDQFELASPTHCLGLLVAHVTFTCATAL